jgi:predicted O-methyltransferase YrrM
MSSITYTKSIPQLLLKVDLYTKTLEYQVNNTIKEIYKTGKTETEDGSKIKITSAIGPYEGYNLYYLVIENKFTNVLEVGMANGLSSLYICEALKKVKKETGKSGKLISIDPFQSIQWKNAGITSIKKAKLKTYHKLIEEMDYIAMPQLIEEDKKFDMVLIDGMHLFDYTILDLFYADILTKVGGVICLDDIKHKGTGKAYDYVVKNYKHWKLIPNTIANKTMATFLKIKEDNRYWNFHSNF